MRKHDTQLVLQAEERPEHVGIEGRGIALGGLVDDRAGLPFGTGTVNGSVDASKSRNGLVHQMADLLLVPDVGLNEHGFCAKAVQFGLKGLPFRLPATGNDQAGTFVRKGNGSGPTDPGQGTRHHHNWLLHVSPPSRHTCVVWLAHGKAIE